MPLATSSLRLGQPFCGRPAPPLQPSHLENSPCHLRAGSSCNSNESSKNGRKLKQQTLCTRICFSLHQQEHYPYRPGSTFTPYRPGSTFTVCRCGLDCFKYSKSCTWAAIHLSTWLELLAVPESSAKNVWGLSPAPPHAFLGPVPLCLAAAVRVPWATAWACSQDGSIDRCPNKRALREPGERRGVLGIIEVPNKQAIMPSASP